ncbi:hypothetical protein CMUS01_03012 [Colletotrichum musicola]|uniref:Uncharacterized protein n=1 Tax=Colletotrichum musicola TaxID=2175873 RepID=A0A8H6NTX4_9PEZI|nr:hypothetical protein CMUS01_03012 [Colletotrichum musicola]
MRRRPSRVQAGLNRLRVEAVPLLIRQNGLDGRERARERAKGETVSPVPRWLLADRRHLPKLPEKGGTWRAANQTAGTTV